MSSVMWNLIDIVVHSVEVSIPQKTSSTWLDTLLRNEFWLEEPEVLHLIEIHQVTKHLTFPSCSNWKSITFQQSRLIIDYVTKCMLKMLKYKILHQVGGTLSKEVNRTSWDRGVEKSAKKGTRFKDGPLSNFKLNDLIG